MKKIVFILTGLLIAAAINAQTLEEIVKKYSEANNQGKISAMSTIKITGKMSMMGMDLPLEMWMKNPDKIKTVTNFNGQEMISVFDGVKGYSINPMTGSAEPVEMSADQVNQSKTSNLFNNYMATYLKEGKLTLLGEEKVNDKTAFKIKVNMDGGNTTDMYIDKGSYLLIKTTTTVSSQGTTVTVESYPSDYKETNGLLLPMKNTSSAQGMEFTIIFDKVEVNIPIEDSVFKIK